MLVYVSFPTDAPCADSYCPDRAYQEEHSHTLYNVYGMPQRLHQPGMSQIDAAEVATDIRPHQSAPVNNTKGVLQNV